MTNECDDFKYDELDNYNIVPPNFTHAMIDIETLATSPDAVVLSVGIVRFDLLGMSYYGKGFVSRLPIQDQIDMGRKVSESTLTWWNHEDRQAAWNWHQERPLPKYGVEQVLSEIEDFMFGTKFVWANSPSFDCVILDSLYRTYDCEIPWSFRSQRDLRTLKALAFTSETMPDSVVTMGIEHTPVADCLQQVEMVFQAYAALIDLDLTVVMA